jgi:hypothetical protein
MKRTALFRSRRTRSRAGAHALTLASRRGGVGVRARSRALALGAGTAIALSLLATATPARADGEVWLWTEARVPIVRTPRPELPRVDWRVVSDFRINKRSEGLAQAFLRTGPILYPTPWAFVAVHGTVYSDRLPSGMHDTEARLELEPNFFGRFGDFTFNDRNRGESRWRESGHRWRYRNQLRVSYAPIGARWIPFVWDEVLVDLSGLGLNQNRAQVGLGRMLDATTRLDIGYMVRSREEPTGWVHDHILNVYLFFDAPKAAPAAPAAPAATPPAPGGP